MAYSKETTQCGSNGETVEQSHRPMTSRRRMSQSNSLMNVSEESNERRRGRRSISPVPRRSSRVCRATMLVDSAYEIASSELDAPGSKRKVGRSPPHRPSSSTRRTPPSRSNSRMSLNSSSAHSKMNQPETDFSAWQRREQEKHQKSSRPIGARRVRRNSTTSLTSLATVESIFSQAATETTPAKSVCDSGDESLSSSQDSAGETSPKKPAWMIREELKRSRSGESLPPSLNHSNDSDTPPLPPAFHSIMSNRGSTPRRKSYSVRALQQ